MQQHQGNYEITPKIATEDLEQMKAVVYLTKINVPFYHIPNGGRRTAREGMKLKRLGVKAGIPDLCIPLARGRYHGLYIELKRQKGGQVSDAQEYWIGELKRQGYQVFVAHGCDELIKYVSEYLKIKDET